MASKQDSKTKQPNRDSKPSSWSLPRTIKEAAEEINRKYPDEPPLIIPPLPEERTKH